jgi:glycerol-3-phosphate acyltransferase PlsY
MLWWPFIPIAFLAGSIPFGYLIARAKGVDLRTVGSKNIGATNLARVFGRPYFFLCFFLDMAKGFLPTALAGWQAGLLGEFVVPAPDAWWWLGVMAAAVLGHMFTPWLRFKGGKGVATGLGALLGVFPAMAVPGLATLLIFLMVVALWRYISAASVTAAATLPLWTWFAHAQVETARERNLANTREPAMFDPGEIQAAVPFMGWPFVIVAGALAALVIYKHRANLARIAAGTEPKLGHRATPPSPTNPTDHSPSPIAPPTSPEASAPAQ